MAFSGVEVKPGKPFTLESIEAIGIKKLHLSQATLGFGQAVLKSTLQCNVGNKSPILLCVLTPDKVDSCQLNLEFEEADEVIFSVIGPRSIHLSGYILSRSPDFRQSSDESEPYGEDIDFIDMDRSSSDDYDYNDSFINDDDLSGCDSHIPSSDHDETKTKGKGGRLRKKFQTFDETLARASNDSLKDDFIQVCNIVNDYKILKVLSSEMPLTSENGNPISKCEKKTIEATVNTNKTLENGDLNDNFENKKISESTTHTNMSLDQWEYNHKSLGDVELSPIMKGCEILSKSSIICKRIYE